MFFGDLNRIIEWERERERGGMREWGGNRISFILVVGVIGL